MLWHAAACFFSLPTKTGFAHASASARVVSGVLGTWQTRKWHQSALVRPVNGHTLRKFPVFTATSRFIAYQTRTFYHISFHYAIGLRKFSPPKPRKSFFGFLRTFCAVYTAIGLFCPFLHRFGVVFLALPVDISRFFQKNILFLIFSVKRPIARAQISV